MAEHTPTPWTSKLYDSQVIVYGPGKIQVVATSWHGSIRSSYPLRTESLANAAFIVKAVNNHASLVKALEQIAEGTPDEAPPFRSLPRDAMQRIARDALDALALVGGAARE